MTQPKGNNGGGSSSSCSAEIDIVREVINYKVPYRTLQLGVCGTGIPRRKTSVRGSKWGSPDAVGGGQTDGREG